MLVEPLPELLQPSVVPFRLDEFSSSRRFRRQLSPDRVRYSLRGLVVELAPFQSRVSEMLPPFRSDHCRSDCNADIVNKCEFELFHRADFHIPSHRFLESHRHKRIPIADSHPMSNDRVRL